jgi:hypothetical protein
VAPILAAADKEGLNGDLPRLFRAGKDVGIGKALGMERL